MDRGAIDDPQRSSSANCDERVEDFRLLLGYPLQKFILDGHGAFSHLSI